MQLIQWVQLYSVSNTLMDSQHKELIKIINSLFNEISGRGTLEKISPILDEIIEYTVFHFQEEEKLLAELGYSELDNHKAQHQAFIERVEKFKKDLIIGKSQLKFDMFSFLKEWLMQHIVSSDKKYMRFFKEKKVKEYFK